MIRNPLRHVRTFLIALALALVGCGAPAEEDAGATEQAQSQACLFETVYGQTYTQAISGAPVIMSARTKLRNHGFSTCPYKVNLEFYSEPYVSPGNVVYNTSIVSATLAGGATQTASHAWTVPSVRPCKFRVWAKYNDTNPNGTQTWHNLGLFDCH